MKMKMNYEKRNESGKIRTQTKTQNSPLLIGIKVSRDWNRFAVEKKKI
jgi:hypothetical protein